MTAPGLSIGGASRSSRAAGDAGSRPTGRLGGPSLLLLLVLLGGSLAAGCTPSTRPGDLNRVQPVSDKPRVGNVYLLRGWIGIFSAGIDELGAKLSASGVRATVYQEDQWRALAAQIKRQYNAATTAEREPIVLIGHSYGADSVLRIANVLSEADIPIDLIITLDPVTPPRVPGNVRRVYNLYQSNGMLDAFPWLRGIPLSAVDERVKVENMDIRRDRTDLLVRGLDHFNIEKQPLIHEDVLRQVLTVCLPRGEFVAASGTARTPAGATGQAGNPKPPTTPGKPTSAGGAP